jgi:hypothetical protein
MALHRKRESGPSNPSKTLREGRDFKGKNPFQITANFLNGSWRGEKTIFQGIKTLKKRFFIAPNLNGGGRGGLYFPARGEILW